MTADVLLSDTFDQMRLKTNEFIAMTQSAGSSNFIKLNNTTNSTSNTTGSIITAGGLGVTASAVVGGDVTIFGDVDIDGVLDFDTFAPDGAVQLDSTLTVGVDGTGYDVKFFGATASAFMLWDESVDDLILAGAAVLSIDTTTDSSSTTTGSFHTDGGMGIAKKLYVGTDLDVDGTTNLDAVDIDGAVQIDNTVAFGTNGSGFDVKFFGDKASAFMMWNESANKLQLGPGSLSGAPEFSIDTTTDSSSTTTGSFHTDGGVGIAKKLYVGTDLDVDGTTNLDAVDIDGAVQIDNTVSVSTNGNGQDVKFFGATSGAYMLWDASADDLILAGASNLSIDNTTDSSSTTTGSFHTDGGVGIAKKLYVGTDLDVDGTSNLDAVDIDGAVQIDNTVSVSTNGNGQDVKFFGATSGSYWHWDASADKVIQVGSSQLTGALTVGVDGTGHDVKLFGDSAGAFMEWDQSADELELRGGAAAPGKLLLSTAEATVVNGNKLGQIDFQAPVDDAGTDAIVVGASILAEADATFSSSVNSTDLVFLTADSGAATEKFRIDSTGVCTFVDGAIDVDIVSHDGSNGLKLGGTLVTATAEDLNDILNQATLGKCIAMVNIFG